MLISHNQGYNNGLTPDVGWKDDEIEVDGNPDLAPCICSRDGTK